MKRTRTLLRAVGCVTLLAAACMLSGCATSAMKGTPFYTGEYEVRQGPAEDRVNLWPLLYYRDPALSVLWPIGEKTEDHFALRPLMSIYGLNDEEQVYNVLWPFACFDNQEDEHYLFPFFWGEDYRTLFPLYWHKGEPFGEAGGYDRLIPLWSYESSSEGGYEANVLWPFIQRVDSPGKKGGRVWPLYGSYARGQKRDTFFLWPLGRVWQDLAANREGQMLLPLFGYERDPHGSAFYSFPYSRGETDIGEEWTLVPLLYYALRDQNRSTTLTPLYSRGENRLRDSSWELLLPLYYSRREARDRVVTTLLGGYSRTPEEKAWMVLPLLSKGRRGENDGEYWFLGPMAHMSWDQRERSHHVLPLYYRSENEERSLLLSLPWSSCRGRDGSGWELLPPLYYHSEQGEREKLITPLYSMGRNAAAGTSWDALFPLYYREKSADGDLLATLLGGYETDAAGNRWLIYPLLSGGSRQEDAGNIWVIAPLLHARWDGEGATHHVLPLYYWNGWERTLVSPLAARWRSDGTETTLVPPLLSWLSEDEDCSDLWGLGGLAHLSWGETPGSQHVLPLFYSDPRSDTFVSAALSAWRDDDERKITLVPPALSWLTESESKSDLWLAGGLAHLSWGEDAGPQHILPLCRWNRKTGSFASPLYAKCDWEGAEWQSIPALLSAYVEDGKEKHLFGALGLFHQEWGRGPEHAEGHLLPLYYYDGKERFLTPLVGWKTAGEEKGFFYPATPLLGLRTGTETGSWLFPVYSHRHEAATGRKHGHTLWGSYDFRDGTGKAALFPFYSYRNRGPLDSEVPEGRNWATFGTSFRAMLLGHCRNETHILPKWAPGQNRKEKPELVRTRVRSNGVWPLWSYESRETAATERLRKKGSFLLLLADHKREVDRLPDTGELNDYSRSRVLWRLWHREELNGKVSVDMPGITYDSRPDGFRKFSFLWRVFRYEKGPEGTKLDIIFPLVRRGAKEQ
jgi:hypothetical protein